MFLCLFWRGLKRGGEDLWKWIDRHPENEKGLSQSTSGGLSRPSSQGGGLTDNVRGGALSHERGLGGGGGVGGGTESIYR